MNTYAANFVLGTGTKKGEQIPARETLIWNAYANYYSKHFIHSNSFKPHFNAVKSDLMDILAV